MQLFICYVILAINFLHYGYSDRQEDLVTYYENLIEERTSEAFHVDLPTSAKEFKPTNTRARGNQKYKINCTLNVIVLKLESLI